MDLEDLKNEVPFLHMPSCNFIQVINNCVSLQGRVLVVEIRDNSEFQSNLYKEVLQQCSQFFCKGTENALLYFFSKTGQQLFSDEFSHLASGEYIYV